MQNIGHKEKIDYKKPTHNGVGTRHEASDFIGFYFFIKWLEIHMLHKSFQPGHDFLSVWRMAHVINFTFLLSGI